tara:strand:+ start:586 stop:1386 length:801 start_codon:yes stop_codon:yes gene_type:complete
MKKLDQYRERIFSASITEIVLLMLFMILAVATLYKADRDKYKAAIEDLLGDSIVAHIDTIGVDSLPNNEILKEIKDRYELSEDQEELVDTLRTQISDLKTQLSLAEGTVVCGGQTDESKRILTGSQTLFDVEFQKQRGKYKLNFLVRDEHLSNVQLNQITPNIENRSFVLKYSKRPRTSTGALSSNPKKNIYHLNFSQVHKFLRDIKNSRKINQNDPRCSEDKYRNKGYCLECMYNIRLRSDNNVSKNDLVEVIKILKIYLNVENE